MILGNTYCSKFDSKSELAAAVDRKDDISEEVSM
jgi:hypothetical protein